MPYSSLTSDKFCKNPFSSIYGLNFCKAGDDEGSSLSLNDFFLSFFLGDDFCLLLIYSEENSIGEVEFRYKLMI
jgi:hypothetical protein